MMQRYNSSSQGQYCYSCGMFHLHSQSCNASGSSFSMVFTMQNGGVFEQPNDCTDYYSSSAVDCTLSLGTPSTRLCEEDEKRRRSTSSSGGPSCMSNFWGLLHTKNASKKAPCNLPHATNVKSGRGGSAGNDPLLARRCANCDTTSTPLWRNGPRGPKSLCNACGIRFKKEERRTTAAKGGGGGATAPVAADHYGHNHGNYNYNNANGNNSSWVHHTPTQRIPCYAANEFRFFDEIGGGGDHHQHDSGSPSAVPFLSWRFNVADRAAGLVHDFTR